MSSPAAETHYFGNEHEVSLAYKLSLRGDNTDLRGARDSKYTSEHNASEAEICSNVFAIT